MFVSIRDEISWTDEVFTYLESYLAFLVAGLIILSSSYGFPFFLVPVSLVFMALFLYYVYRSLESKGESFVIIIFIVMFINILVILSDLLMRLICRKRENSPYYYA